MKKDATTRRGLRKVVATVLAVFLLFGAVSESIPGLSLPLFTAHAAEVLYSGECGAEGDNLTWTLDSEGTLTISGTGSMYYDIRWSGSENWAQNYDSVKKLIVSEGVTEIADEAFSGFVNLKDVSLPQSLERIGSDAFDETAIEEITIPGNVRNAGYCLQGCSKLKKVVYEEGVEMIQNQAFFGCSELETVIIPSTMRDIDPDWLNGCDSENLNVSISAENEFFTNLNGLIIDNNLYEYGRQPELHSVLPTVSGTVYVPENINVIGVGALENAPKIEKLVIHAGVTEIQSPGWTIRCAVAVDGKNKYFSSDANGCLYNKSKTILCSAPSNCTEDIAVPEGVVEIGSAAFYETDFNSVTLPNSLVSIKSEAFYNSGLKELVIPKNVKFLEERAISCSGMEKLEILANIEYMGNEAITGCYSLEDIKISGSLPSYEAFRGAPMVEECEDEFVILNGALLAYKGSDASVVVPNGVTAIESFGYNNNVTEVTLPSSVRRIGSHAFSGTEYLQKINYSGTLDAVEDGAFDYTRWLYGQTDDFVTIGSALIKYNGSAETVTVPEGITVIAAEAFMNNNNLEKVVLPKSLVNIGDKAFDSCYNLKEVNIVDGVVSIGDEAFSGTYNISSLILPDSLLYLGNNAFSTYRLDTFIIGDNLRYIGAGAYSDSSNKVYNVPESIVCAHDRAVNGVVRTDNQYIKDLSQVSGFVCLEDETEFLVYNEDGVTLVGTLDSDNCLTLRVGDDDVAYMDIWEKVYQGVEKVIISNDVEILPRCLFDNCETIAEVEFEENSSLKKIEVCAFEDTAIKSITIPASVTTVEHNVFMGCSKLVEIKLEEGNVNFRIKDGCLYSSDMTDFIAYPVGIVQEYFVIPKTVKGYFDTEIFWYGSESPYDYHSVAQIFKETENNTAMLMYTFTKDLKIPSKVDGLTVTKINDYAMSDKTRVTVLDMPEGMTEVGIFAFNHNLKLTEVYVPSTMTTIGAAAFKDCVNLTDVYYAGSEEDWAKISIGEKNEWLTGANIHFGKTKTSSGVTAVIYRDELNIDSETELCVEDVTDAPEIESGIISVLDGLGTGHKLFDISFVKDGKEVQPSSPLTIKIPVPAGYDAASCEVYHVLDDGTMENMNAVVDGGYLVFTAKSFSLYAVVNDQERLPGDINSDGEVNMKDSTILRRYLAGWDVTINESNADVNGDGEVNLLDSTILRRHLANWQGVELV